GKGGKNISNIRNNTGSNIRVCPAPHCAAKDEELILINGESLAVKKALIYVSYCLQDCPPLAKVSLNAPTINYSDRSTSNTHEDLFPNLNSWLPPSMEAGSVIGKKGSIVRTFEIETGASIIFAPPISHFEERIVTISAFENLESSNSPAQDAVILVFARIVEDHIRNGFHPASTADSPVTARLLIAPSTVNLLTGNEGEVISELREVSGADIQLLLGEP
ncbi:KH domain-containing protein, partial [Trifolium medium]|nr:KH domain-containing protein [Trifolium medium]